MDDIDYYDIVSNNNWSGTVSLGNCIECIPKIWRLDMLGVNVEVQ